MSPTTRTLLSLALTLALCLSAALPLGCSAATDPDPGQTTDVLPENTEPCVGSCDGRTCGDDGCGRECGVCGEAEICDGTACVPYCVPECVGKRCGDDGCGDVCGECPEWAPICTEDFQCADGCVPDCTGMACGDDGCGGACGPGCPEDQYCDQGACADYCTPDPECGEGLPETGCANEAALWVCTEVVPGCHKLEGPVPCEDGAVCVAGECLGLECEPYDILCDGVEVIECDETGAFWWIVEDCGSYGEICLDGWCELCEGEDCPCVGDDCPCEGEDCPCEGEDCPCVGDDCPCEGEDCPPPPATDECVNPQDQAVLAQPGVMLEIQGCLATCLINSVCLTQCLEDLGATNGCAQCATDMIFCAVAPCAAKCIGGFTDDCLTCAAVAGCQAKFEICAGIPFPGGSGTAPDYCAGIECGPSMLDPAIPCGSCADGFTCDATGSCVDDSVPGGVICGEASENTNLVLTCPPASVVSEVTFASYGAPNGTCGSYEESACHSPESQMVVEDACLGKPTCSVPATDEELGNPCPGIPKWMRVQATCGAAPGG